MNLKIPNAEHFSDNKQKYIEFLNQSETFQDWLRQAPSQLLELWVKEDPQDGLFRISILLKNAYLFDDDEDDMVNEEDKKEFREWLKDEKK